MSHKMETRLIWFKEMKPLCKRLLDYMLFFVNFSEKIMRIHMLMSLGFLPGHRNVVFGDLKRSFVPRLVFARFALPVLEKPRSCRI